MNKAIIYARVSSKDQDLQFSIPAQLKLLHAYASQNNIRIAESFKDVETAKKAGRTEFNRMLAYLKENNTVQHILVEKTDRLLRNITDYALVDQLIEDFNITIHLVKENVILSKDSRSNEKFIFGIKALMAKNYSDNLSEEVRKGMLEKASQGIYPSIAPYGYLNAKVDGKKLIVIDPDAAAYIKQMFFLFASGSYSLSTLKNKMLADGMVYRGGKKLYKSKIEAILKNEFYTGVFYWKNKRYDNASHEPIVSRELFQRVQARLASPRKGKSRKGLFAYTNLITCGVCGCSLTAEIKKEKYIYYRCTGYKGNCKQPYLKKETLEKTFENLLHSICITDEIHDLIMQALRSSLQDKIEYHNKTVAQIERQIKALQNRIDQAYMDKLDGKITEEFWRIHSSRWMVEKEGLSTKLFNLQKADQNYLKNANMILELSKKAVELYKTQNQQEKRKLFNILVSNCSYKDGKLDLELQPVFNEVLKARSGNTWCARQDSNLRPTD